MKTNFSKQITSFKFYLGLFPYLFVVNFSSWFSSPKRSFCGSNAFISPPPSLFSQSDFYQSVIILFNLLSFSLTWLSSIFPWQFLNSILRRCQSICCLIFVNDFLWLSVDRSIFVQRTSIEWKHLYCFWKLSKKVNTIKLKIRLMIRLQEVTVIDFKRKLPMSRNKKFILVVFFVAKIHLEYYLNYCKTMTL